MTDAQDISDNLDEDIEYELGSAEEIQIKLKHAGEAATVAECRAAWKAFSDNRCATWLIHEYLTPDQLLADIKVYLTKETKMTKKEEINDIKDCIASWRRQRDMLEMRYQGVRPSYVSTDLAILGERIDRFVAKLVEMEG